MIVLSFYVGKYIYKNKICFNENYRFNVYNKNMKYIPLNIYTCYSFLSSSLKINDIFSLCEKSDYEFFGINDYNVMFSYSEISKINSKFKSKPILGASFFN